MTDRRRYLVAALAGVTAGSLCGYLTGRHRAAGTPAPNEPAAAFSSDDGRASPRPPGARRRSPAPDVRVGHPVDRAVADGRIVVDLWSLPGRPRDAGAGERDRDWAPMMERSIRLHIASRLEEDYPDARLTDVRCTAVGCVIEYDLPSDRAEEIWIFLQITMPHGDQTRPRLGEDEGGRTKAAFEATFDALRSAADYDDWFAEMAVIGNQQRAAVRQARQEHRRWWE